MKTFTESHTQSALNTWLTRKKELMKTQREQHSPLSESQVNKSVKVQNDFQPSLLLPPCRDPDALHLNHKKAILSPLCREKRMVLALMGKHLMMFRYNGRCLLAQNALGCLLRGEVSKRGVCSKLL